MQKNEAMENQPSLVEELAQHLEQQLLREIGPILVGDDLRRCLGYRTLASLHQALKRRMVPVPVFQIKNRRGKYALTKDVAYWLASQRAAVGLPVDGTEQD